MTLTFSLLTLAGAGTLTARFRASERAAWLPGETSHGHYQIEMACNRCHTPFGGVSQDACLECHAEELERADDSHPAAKFTDPRNADLLVELDALRCVSCHVEHRPERTQAMTVTQPIDYCVHCHAGIGEERATHRGLTFDGCRASGCHNFHDNRALTLEHLQRHLDEPPTRAIPAGVERRPTPDAQRDGGPTPALADAPAEVMARAARALSDWQQSAHARASVSCSDCHGAAAAWIERPGLKACERCHETESQGFLGGRHGMRLAVGLSPMRPSMARAPMRAEAAGQTLDCNRCHGAHTYDTRHAALDACLECHADRHSLAYAGSPHAQSWQRELEGTAPAGSGVSCATCHLPRLAEHDGRVQHNQNDNLRPSTKQLRGVCDRCHGLGFALDALADRELVERAFVGQPAHHVPSLDWASSKLPRERAQRSEPSVAASAADRDEI